MAEGVPKSKPSKNSYEILVGIIVLHLIAVVAKYHEFLLPEQEFLWELCGFLRSYIYMALFTLWGVYIRHRIVSRYTRRYLVEIVVMMVLWMFFRTVKYTVVLHPTFLRYLWYLYYLPILFIFPLCVLVAMSVEKMENPPSRGCRHSLMTISAVLFWLVMTNDHHQLVFVFPKDVAYFSDHAYSYGPGYYMVVGWCFLCIAITMTELFLECRNHRGRKYLYLPLLPMILGIIYLFLYTRGAWITRTIFSDMTICMCLCIIASFECCIRYKLIQSNAQYKELFRRTDLSVYITDREGELYLVSGGGARMLPQEAMALCGGESIILGDRIRWSAYEIDGGLVYWADDVSETVRSIQELQDLHESLEQSSALAEEELRTNREKTRLAEANRLYYEMQQKTAGYLARMEALVKKIEETEDKKEEQVLLGELTLLGAYFKRRNNLFFLEQAQKEASEAELGYCLRESLAALELLGTKGSYLVDLSAGGRGDFDIDKAENVHIPLSDVIALYDCFEAVVELVFRDVLAMAVVVGADDECYQFTVDLHMREGMESQFDALPKDRYEIEQEDDDEFVVTCKLERGRG